MSPAMGPPKDKIPITDYLRATDSVSRPLAIFLVLVILSVLTSIIFGLFLGGRWAYNELKGNNKTAITTQNIDSSDSKKQSDNSGSGANLGSNANLSPSPTPTTTPALINVTPSTTPASASPNTNSNIPNTGPEPE